MDELRPNLSLLSVNLVENEVFHLNHNQERKKCNSNGSNEQDFSLYSSHQNIESGSPTHISSSISARNTLAACTTGKIRCKIS